MTALQWRAIVLADHACLHRRRRMMTESRLLDTIEAVHRAGLEEERWPEALGAVAQLVGGECATLEALAVPSLQHCDFRGFNVPPASEMHYLRDYAALSPRIPFTVRRRAGELVYDHLFMDDRSIDRDPFYAEFLARLDLRYFVAAILERSRDRIVTVSVQRSPRRGHIDASGFAALRQLLPHLRQAYDVAERLRGAEERGRELESALQWLGDGVILAGADGSVRYMNDMARSILSRRDGMWISQGRLQFEATAAAEFDLALGRIGRLRDGFADGGAADIAVRREAAPAYVVSVRPMARACSEKTAAMAIMFIHDPLRARTSQASTLRAAFGLTDAEARLAQALQAGTSPSDYARQHLLSLNTVYTHLRRIKDKTRCKRLAELIRILNDLQPLP
jgi:DNA-binding CsgD family transcriptional regulator